MTEVKTEKLANIKPDQTNANRHTERGNAMLRDSIDEFGFAEAGTLDANNRIIGGNHRTEVAADVLGSDEAIVIEVDGTKPVYIKRSDIDLKTEKGRRLAYALNRVAQISIDFDPEQVLADINADINLDGLFYQNEIDELIADLLPDDKGKDTEPEISRADALQQEWQTETGQLWALGEHRLICGDCTDEAAVKRLMGQDKACLYSTDPPYGVAYGVETGSDDIKYSPIANDENDGERLQAFLESAFSLHKTILIDNAAWYLWRAQMTQGFFAAAAAAAAAVIIHRQIIWVKPSLVLGHGDYHWRHELCFYGWIKGNRPDWYGDRSQTTIWEIGRENDKIHPTQKPTEIFERPMRFNTKPNDIVFEPFSGSGSQIIAAENMSRRCRAMELDKNYVAVTLQRFYDHTQIKPELIDE